MILYPTTLLRRWFSLKNQVSCILATWNFSLRFTSGILWRLDDQLFSRIRVYKFRKLNPWTHDVNWMYIRRSADVRASPESLSSCYVLCPVGTYSFLMTDWIKIFMYQTRHIKLNFFNCSCNQNKQVFNSGQTMFYCM